MGTIDRRTFLTVLGAAGAAATLAKPDDAANKLIPYVIPPEKVRPGVWVNYATTCRECPAGCGMHVRHRDSRVIKAEGNPQHPVSYGGLCPRGQSAPQGLYDPDRVIEPLKKNGNEFKPISWVNAYNEINTVLKDSSSNIAMISDLQTGSIKNVINQFLDFHKSKRLLIYEPFNYEPIRMAHSNLFGINGIPRYHIDQCDFLISFGADFLETWISPVEYAYHFGNFRSVSDNSPGKFVYMGPRLSMTAANADDFILISPGADRWVALAMLQVMLDENLIKYDKSTVPNLVSQMGGDRVWNNCTLSKERVTHLSRLFASAKNPLALSSPVAIRNNKLAIDCAEVTALLNYSSGSINKTHDFSRLHALSTTSTESETVKFLDSISEKDILFIINSNIAYTRPDSIPYLRKAKAIIYLTSLPDETAELATWILPIDTPLESWGDYEPYNGIYSTIQPSMGRLYSTKGIGEILLSLTANENFDSHNFFHSFWQALHSRISSDLPFAQFWNHLLKSGTLVENANSTQVNIRSSELQPFTNSALNSRKITLWTWPSIMLFDGRLANRGWMQESPEPVSYTAWGNWVDIHPKIAKDNHIGKNSVIKITSAKGAIELPVRLTEQVASGTIAIMIGQGHTAKGLSVANNIGQNPFLLSNNENAELFDTVKIETIGENGLIVYTSPTYNQYDRGILKTVKVSELENAELTKEKILYPLSAGYSKEKDFYSAHPHRKHRWAMVVDLQRCIGCGACAVGCYAENNIPVMGKITVNKGREMAWLKVVPYAVSKSSLLAWIPILCQHCDDAPCEPVCPVYASVHNEEGLNAQIYNRCIGTRYCSNNCPYKVRRFNWFNVEWRKPLNVQLNPEVTVRCRGVMEKCTFCVQRIREVEYRALAEHREIRDGEIQPACVQSCPTKVFTFGDLFNPDAQVTKMIQCDPRRYQVLRELNTKPAVIYLKKVVSG